MPTSERLKRVTEFFENFNYNAMRDARENGTEHPEDFRITEIDIMAALRVLVVVETEDHPDGFNSDYYMIMIERLTHYSGICNDIANGIVGRPRRGNGR